MIHFKEIAARYGIGMLLSAPVPVLGGLLHTTYRMDTSEGSFAVKILNPAVMKRPRALENTIRSEKIAAAFRESLPAVSAMESDGCPVSEIGGEYVLLYPWISGKPVFPPKLGPKNAAAIGDVLAKMHEIGETLDGELRADGEPEEDADPDRFEKLLSEASVLTPDAPWLPVLRDSLPTLVSREKAALAAVRLLPETAVSHRDLDPKNVLWENTNPYVIDWESAGPVHPVSELLETLLSWSDDGQGELRRDCFDALLSAYRARRDMNEDLWDAVFAAAPLSRLDWLAYNVRRASGIETADAHDRLVGASEAAKTLRQFGQFEKNLSSLREWLGV